MKIMDIIKARVIAYQVTPKKDLGSGGDYVPPNPWGELLPAYSLLL